MSTLKDVSIIVKWNGKEYPITDLSDQETVAVLKHEIAKLTNVRPERQKLLNLKHRGKSAADDLRLSALDLKPNFKLMMVGSLEVDIQDVQNSFDNRDVIDDFDDDNDERTTYNFHKVEIYLAKVEKRVQSYKIQELNPPRESKRLLVLDIDYTLFDHRSCAETAAELMRPYLHEFLTSAYEDYDIVIWSATGMRWIVEKMQMLGVTNNPNYKIMFHLCSSAMISVYHSEMGAVDVKPLGVIWGKYKQYSAKNTIMFDDIRRNFLMNPQSGLKIRPYRQAHFNRQKDNELLKLKKYLKDIATHCDGKNIIQSHLKYFSMDKQVISHKLPTFKSYHRNEMKRKT